MLKNFKKIRSSIKRFMARRPHRSFRLTRRRDYRRSLKLPGYIGFTRSVNRTVWKYRKPLLWLIVVYVVFSTVLVGIGSQDNYTTLTDTLSQTGDQIFQGNLGHIGEAAILLATITTNGLSGTLTEGQQIYSILLVLLVWLTTVWLLRNLLAGHKVRMRDGLYSAGSPIIATLLVGLVLVIQLLPIGIAIIGYSAALASGLLAGGVATMLFWVAAVLLAILSLYWITSTFFALVIVTLPGMYPMKALRAAGDMVVGRRVRILLRMLWMFLMIVLGWVIVMIPVILIDTWIKNTWSATDWVPVVPFFLLIMSTLTIVWMASYVYLLYRKVVDDDAAPA